jgi:hypothetical protein
MNNNTNVYSLLKVILIAIAALVGGGAGGELLALLPGLGNAIYGRAEATIETATITTNHTQTAEEEEIGKESLFISQHIPLTGQLENGDYIHLIDFTPFNTTAEGHSHIAIKVPCDNNGKPLVTIITGVAPNFTTLDIGNAINNGTLDGRNIDLSVEGTSCLYHGDIPNGITDIALVNTSNQTLNFDTGGYTVAITAHATVSEEGSGVPH